MNGEDDDSPDSQQDRRWNEPVLSRPNASRQHYVPRLYLSQFAHEEVVNAYDLDEDRCFKGSPINLALEKGYNDFIVGDKISVSTEEWLSDVESRAAPIIRELAQDPSFIERLGLDTQLYLARYLAAQKVRGPGYRSWERAVRDRTVREFKSIAKAQIYGLLPDEEAEKQWQVWKDKPIEWWLQEPKPLDEAEGAATMLGEVQGWAQLLMSADWRAGLSQERVLYTCDNPLSEYLPSVRPWYAFGAMDDHGYVFALSPHTLLWVYPKVFRTDAEPMGSRLHKDFQRWEASVALHIITRNATRFLYGDGPYVSQPCAEQCLKSIDEINVLVAMKLQGFDPRRPEMKLPESLEGESKATDRA